MRVGRNAVVAPGDKGNHWSLQARSLFERSVFGQTYTQTIRPIYPYLIGQKNLSCYCRFLTSKRGRKRLMDASICGLQVFLSGGTLLDRRFWPAPIQSSLWRRILSRESYNGIITYIETTLLFIYIRLL